MKLRPLLYLAMMLVVNAALAQFKIGPKATAYLSDLGDHQFVLNEELIIGKGSIRGNYTDLHYSFGLFGRYDFSKTYLQAEVLTASYSSRIQFYPVEGSFVGEDEMFGSGDLTFKISRIEIPLCAGVKVGVLRFQAGLVPAFISKANVAYSTGARVSEDARPYQAIGEVQDKDQYHKLHIDGQGVIGVTIFKRIYLDLKAQTNITNLRKDITILGTRLNSKEKLFSYGVSLAVNVLR